MYCVRPVKDSGPPSSDAIFELGSIDAVVVAAPLGRKSLKNDRRTQPLVFLVAHEAFHYLRRTKQVPGRHGEIEADAFALKMLEHYRDGSDLAKTPTRNRL